MKKICFVILYITAVYCTAVYSEDEEENQTYGNREKKILPIFQVVRFPNDPCTVTGGSKNGTCYTSEECSTRGGINAGGCAQGFGVCCTFSYGCGGSSSENCTYFDSSTSVSDGQCKFEICKCSDNICQIRLDFHNFVISGPTTSSASVTLMLAGEANPAGVAVADTTQCLTDTFSIGNQQSVPVICGVNSGHHVYFDVDDECHDLNFQLGNNPQGISSLATRSWNIKITQYSCDYDNLAPSGCTQWHFGSDASNYVQTFNYQSGLNSGKHLASQDQIICVRREAGNCRICWSADALKDVGVSQSPTNMAVAVVLGTMCCNYGAEGKIAAIGGYDCIILPGAVDAASAAKPDKICGTMAGLFTAADMTGKTICSKQYPFRIEFHSDAYEHAVAAMDESDGGNFGFKLRYFQTTC